ncbi:hypothetical protein ACFSC4_25060 [Deinococcus malanensis]|uniref:hypothetical protein n=1 Tax=Deinococcus malanensis TaxID=1706855 RepID=UPI00363FBCFE
MTHKLTAALLTSLLLAACGTTPQSSDASVVNPQGVKTPARTTARGARASRSCEACGSTHLAPA